MKSIFCAALLVAAFPVASFAQTADQLLNAEKSPQDVLTYGMSYSQQRFSPLTQINRDNVKRLVPAWSYSMNNDTGEESQPLVYDGVIYVTSQNKTVAVDALTGKEIWNTPIEYPADTTRVVCCGIVNRGAAIYQGKLFRTTLDAHVMALDMKTGKVIWNIKSGDAKDGIAMTGAPLIADGVLITGMAGAEFDSRGYVEAYDPDTGKRLWRHYTVPRPGEPGADSWPDHAAHAGGGSSWTTGSFDPDLDLVYWGIGNPAPWNALLRKGDDLYTNTILALRPKTGEVVWYYQTSPNDPFDHDNITSIILATLTVDGKPTKVLLQAGRNGFYYVIDRKSGQLVAANPYVKSHLGHRHRQGNRPAAMDADHQDSHIGQPTGQDLAAHYRRHQLVPIVVRSANADRLRQHHRLRHDLRARSDRRDQGSQAGRSGARGQDHADLQRRWDARPSARHQPPDRYVEMGDPLQEPELVRDSGDGGRARLHRRTDRRVHRR